MSEKTRAGMAGPVTPVVDPFGGFQCDDYRLKAVESRHAKEKDIAKTHAWASVLKLAIPVVVVAVVFLCAMVLGVPLPWELALSFLSGRSPVH